MMRALYFLAQSYAFMSNTPWGGIRVISCSKDPPK